MRSLLSHAYHLLLLPIHVLLWPFWRPLAVAFVLALGARAAGRWAGVAACGAVLAGWLVLAPPEGWPPPPIERLPGLALLVLAWSAWAPAPRAADTSWTALVAALVLAGGLRMAHASPHWAWAACVSAAAALATLGVRAAQPALVGLTILVAAMALWASDRGRVIPVDIACALPILVSTSFLKKRSKRLLSVLSRTK